MGPRVTLSGQRYIELNFDPKLEPAPEQIEEAVKVLRGILSDVDVWLDTNAVRFPSGQALNDWIADVKAELKPNEVVQ